MFTVLHIRSWLPTTPGHTVMFLNSRYLYLGRRVTGLFVVLAIVVRDIVKSVPPNSWWFGRFFTSFTDYRFICKPPVGLLVITVSEKTGITVYTLKTLHHTAFASVAAEPLGRARVRYFTPCFWPLWKNTYRVLKKYVRASRNPYKIRLKFKKPGGLWWNF